MTRVILMGVSWDMRRLASVKEIRNAVPDVETVWDQNQDAMDTWLRVLDEAGSDPVVILEDDVILTSNWREKVEQVISQRPDKVIQFFSRGKTNESLGARMKFGSTFRNNQCYYLPAGVAAELRRFATTWIKRHPEHPTGYDILMADYLGNAGEKYWAEIPSLVQHRALPSAIGWRSMGRQSESFQP